MLFDELDPEGVFIRRVLCACTPEAGGLSM